MKQEGVNNVTPTPTRSSSTGKQAVYGRAVDGGWGWMVVAGCCLGHFLLVGLSRTLGVFFVYWMDKYQSNAVETAWVQSLFNTMRMIAGPFVSILCNRWGCRKVVILGGVLYTTGCLLGAFATTIVHLYLSFSVIGGLGGGFILTPMFVMLNEYFDKKKGIAMGLSTMGTGVGLLVMAPVFTYMLDEYGHFGAMLLAAGLALNTLVIAALFRPFGSRNNLGFVKGRTADMNVLFENGTDEIAVRRDQNIVACDTQESVRFNDRTVPCDTTAGVWTQHGTDADIESSSTPSSESCIGQDQENDEKSSECWRTTRCQNFKKSFVLLKSLTFWIYSFYLAALPCGVQIYTLFTPGLMEEHNMTDRQGALVMSVAGASDAVGRCIAGLIFDSKAVRNRRWPAHCIYGIGLGLAVLLNGVLTDFVGFIIMGIIWGLFEAGYHSQRATILSEFISKDQLTRSLGLMLFWQGVGSLMSPPFAGFLKDEFQTFSVCFYYGGTAMMFCASLFLTNYMIVKSRRKKPSCTCDKYKIKC